MAAVRFPLLATSCIACFLIQGAAPPEADVLIIGAGIGGLSAALEAGRRGASVQVVDMSSVFGGHAVMSEGGLSLVEHPSRKRERLKIVRNSHQRTSLHGEMT